MMNPDQTGTGGYEHRFGSRFWLYGEVAIEALRQAHVMVVGIGGVGSWVGEALARSGVGELPLVNWDDICFSNTNHQIHAMTAIAGRAKVEILSERIRLECKGHP